MEPDGASYWSYKLAEEEAEKESQRETTSSEPAKEDNQSKTQESEADFEEEDDSDSTALNVEVDVDLDKDVPVTDDVTTQPVLPWDILIEGSPSEGTVLGYKGMCYDCSLLLLRVGVGVGTSSLLDVTLDNVALSYLSNIM